jgi:hypothetical protein
MNVNFSRRLGYLFPLVSSDMSLIWIVMDTWLFRGTELADL